MEKILVLGAGMMARPLVSHFVQRKKYVILVDLNAARSESMIWEDGCGRFETLDVHHTDKLRDLIRESNITVSLLPWKLHWLVGKECLELNKNLVTASYVGEEMKLAASRIKEKGLLFLNEAGLDPGLDHIMILRTIDDIRIKGGSIQELHTYGTSLPSFGNNNNPFHYKFSWSPKGFLLGGLRNAYYIENGEEKHVREKEIYRTYYLKKIHGLGEFEVFPNGDAKEYMQLYHIPEVQTIRRNTLRHIDSCELWEHFKRLGFYDDMQHYDFEDVTFEQIIRTRIGISEQESLLEGVADYLKIPQYSSFLRKMEWLGLFGQEHIPIGKATMMEGFCYVLQKKLGYLQGEKDLVVLIQEFIVNYKNGKKEKITNTLIREGVVHEESATSFLVAKPLAIATDLVLSKKIKGSGVKIPNEKEIYMPLFTELEANGINMKQSIESIN